MSRSRLDASLNYVPSQSPLKSQRKPTKVVPSAAKACHDEKTGTQTILPIDDRCRLAGDRYSWMIQKHRRRKTRRGNAVVDDWETFSWHPTIEQAVNALADYQLRTSGAQTLADALAEVKRINAALTRALSPRLEVKERAA